MEIKNSRRVVLRILPSVLVAGLLGSLLPSHTLAQSPRERILVSTEWLAKHLGEENLVLLHVSPEEEYAEEHIPGARHLTHQMVAAPREPGGLTLELPDPEVLVETLEGLGIGDGTRIIVYWGSDWVTPSTRVVFTLDWIGLGDRTSILDGGMPKWKAEGRPTTSEVTGPPSPVHLTPRPHSELLVQADWIKDHMRSPGFQLVDARSPTYYTGNIPEERIAEGTRPGHIPSAVNIYASDLINEDLTLRSSQEMARIFSEAGVEKGETVVAYCHIGQYATLVAFGARTLGISAVLYDGSFQEWERRTDLPVEVPGGGG